LKQSGTKTELKWSLEKCVEKMEPELSILLGP